MNISGSDLPVIIGQTGPLNGEMWNIEDSLLIGRDPSCQVAVPDRQVSRYHARLTITDKGPLLEDLASKNGTYLNGSRVEIPEYIQDGDVIQIALVQTLVFLSSDATMPMGYGAPLASPIVSGKLRLDPSSHRVWIAGQEIVPPLSLAQFSLLQKLYEQQGNVIDRQSLINAVWEGDEASGVSEQAFDALVRRLRERLVDFDPGHEYIVTLRGHGLRLDNPPR